MLDVVEGKLCLLDVLMEVLEMSEVIRCAVLCMLDVVEGKLCSLEVLVVPEVIRCTLLCMLETMEGRLCSLEALEVLEGRLFSLGLLVVLAVPDVMQRARHGDGGGCNTCQLINGKGVKEVKEENCDRK